MNRPVRFCTSTDTNLFKWLKMFKEHEHLIGTTEYNTRYKAFCDVIREQIGETKIIGFGSKRDESEAAIFIYDIEATEDNFFVQKYDETGPYVEELV